MVKCPKCHNDIQEGMRFRENCGIKIEREKLCSNCGKKIAMDSALLH